MSWESRTLAYALRGASQGDDDLYVMINLGEEAQTFTIQEWERPLGGSAGGWLRCVDTWRPSPEDIAGPGQEPALDSRLYLVQPRSVVVLRRPQG